VNEPPPAELLARLRPIPTYRDHPATTPHDVVGLSPDGQPIRVDLINEAQPALLLFLSSTCSGCQDLWQGMAELRSVIPADLRVIVVTRGLESENPVAIAALAQPGTTVVMSTPAYADYRVAGPPFLVVVAGGVVKTEGVAWGIEETGRATRAAFAGGSE
jgi:hypothetical protein